MISPVGHSCTPVDHVQRHCAVTDENGRKKEQTYQSSHHCRSRRTNTTDPMSKLFYIYFDIEFHRFSYIDSLAVFSSVCMCAFHFIVLVVCSLPFLELFSVEQIPTEYVKLRSYTQVQSVTFKRHLGTLTHTTP